MVFLFEGLDLPVKDISFYQPAFKKVTLQKMNQRGALSPSPKWTKLPPNTLPAPISFSHLMNFFKNLCVKCVYVLS